MNILEKICANTRSELEARRMTRPLESLKEACAQAGPCRGFAARLMEAEDVALIAEIKKASPSAGVIRTDFDPRRIARAYSEADATAISVLTDSRFFQGDLSYLGLVRAEVGLPLLRKDFILDEYQVFEARAAGADAILLIASCLDDEALYNLRRTAESLGMDALVEVHDADEMKRAAESGATLIGINNRDLRTFKVSIETSIRLAAFAPAGALLVSESGIRNRSDICALAKAGVKAVLVGETLMRAPDVAEAVRRLLSPENL